MRLVSIALVVASLPPAVALAGCGPRAVGHGEYVIRGSIVDAETGAPVSGKDMYVHAWNDAIGRQTSIEKEDAATFTVRMPRPAVRLRVADTSGRYRLYETTLDVPAAGLDHVVRLVPTHYVLLKGRLLVRDGDRWVPVPPQKHDGEIGGRPLLSFGLEGERPGGFAVTLAGDASFEVRVPRGRLRPYVLDTPLAPETTLVDLTGVTSDVVERDVHLVANR